MIFKGYVVRRGLPNRDNGWDALTQSDDRDREIAKLRERLTRLSEASLRINDSLDPDAVLQRVLDSARSLIGAPYGLMTTLDESGGVRDFLASGLTPEEAQRLWAMPGGMDVFEYLRTVPGPLRIADFAAHVRSLGLPDFLPPTPMSSYLRIPIRHRGDEVGSIHIANAEPGREFSREDEETLVMFASQAAMVIANARRHRDEQRARAYAETLVETSPVGVVVFNARTGEPVSFNQEGVRIVNSLIGPDQTPEQLLETMTCRRADGREVPLMEWPLAEALSGGETVRAEEIVLSVPSGQSVTVLLNATPVRSEDGVLQSFVVTMQDMTPLEELERLRAEFLAMVSHELRTPLTSIRGSATTMQEAVSDLDPVELRQFLRIIVDQSDNMRELIDDLLDVARIETGTLPVKPEPAEVAQMVDQARNTFLSGGGRGALEIDLAPDLPLVMADKRRIVQVMGNLLSNAARSSPESSPIRVTAVKDGVHVAISVTDEGRGIPAEQLPHLFHTFSRPIARRQGGDVGLGLAICKGIVEAHGGRIWAENQGASLGARFTFTVPAVDEATAADSLRRSGRASDGAGAESILVVDDDPQTLMYVRRALSAAGYDPIVTADPDEALRLMQRNAPRLVLLDMMLPGADGLEVMRDIFSIADVPVVFLSAYGQEAIVARAFQMGAADYIVKPFTPTELDARVRAALLRREERYRDAPSEPYLVADLRIDYVERRVFLAGRQLHLTAKEYGLLTELSINAGRVLTHERLLRRLWTPGKPGNVQSLRTLVRRLRTKLGEDADTPTYIFAEARIGYRMPKSEASEPE